MAKSSWITQAKRSDTSRPSCGTSNRAWNRLPRAKNFRGRQAARPLPKDLDLGPSKADLLPDLDVFDFRDLLIGKAADEIAELRDLHGVGSLPKVSLLVRISSGFRRRSSSRQD